MKAGLRYDTRSNDNCSVSNYPLLLYSSAKKNSNGSSLVFSSGGFSVFWYFTVGLPHTGYRLHPPLLPYHSAKHISNGRRLLFSLCCGDFMVFSLKYIFYYMVSSAGRQDDPNRALWLATREGKMEYLAPSGLPAVSREKISPKAK